MTALPVTVWWTPDCGYLHVEKDPIVIPFHCEEDPSPMYESEHDTQDGPVKVPHPYPDTHETPDVRNDPVDEPAAPEPAAEPEPKPQEDPR